MIDEKQNTTEHSDTDALAYYRIVTNAYKMHHKCRTWIFNKILKHMLSKMKEECSIFYLMQAVKENRH